MNLFLTDLCYAWRSARRSPGVTLAIIAMLALGTGGLTAIFNPLYSTLFTPLPFPQPEQLVQIGGDIPLYNIRFKRFEPAEKLERIFSNLTSYKHLPSQSIPLRNTGETKQFHVVDVDENFFETLGVLPLRGSSFKQSEIRNAYIVSNRFWRNELMGAEDAVGKPIAQSDASFLIIGIMPESFDFPAGADVWIHRGANMAAPDDRRFLGRLRPETTFAMAAEELKADEFKQGKGLLLESSGPVLQSLRTVIYGDRRPILLILGSTAVLFLLLICAGVMNLLITQGTRRKSEIAMRLIFGASRRNLVFQLLRETLPLVVAGALAGFWLSEIAGKWLVSQFPALKSGEVVIPVKMAFFAALVFFVTIISGLTPALYASGVDLNTYLKSGGSDSARRRFLPIPLSMRELLVGTQLGLSLALLTGVGLLVNSMMFHVDVPIRWSSRDMAVVRVEIPPVVTKSDTGATYIGRPNPESMIRNATFFQEFQDYLITMPEVAATGIFRPVPFSADAEREFQVPSGAVFSGPSSDPERVWVRSIIGRSSQEGFDMLGVTLFAGRHFSSEEIAGEIAFNVRSRETGNTTGRAAINTTGGVALVNQALARQFWPGENAVGKMIYDGLSNAYEIVGVVRDFYYFSNNKDFIPAVYYPPDTYNLSQAFLVRLHSKSLMKDFRQRLSGFDAGSAKIEAQPLEEIVYKATANMRIMLQLIGSFALLGIVVAGLGVYATTSLMAATWNREMGIRMAIGAQAWDILRLALWRSIRAILFGTPVGLFLAWILSRSLSSYLFQVKIDDPFVWIISCALLLIITTAAAFFPALRMSCINPMDVLRK